MKYKAHKCETHNYRPCTCHGNVFLFMNKLASWQDEQSWEEELHAYVAGENFSENLLTCADTSTDAC